MAATGRDLDDVQTAVRCLLADEEDPSPEHIARAAIHAFGFLDLRIIAKSLSGTT